MITKLITLVSSLVAGASMLVGQAVDPARVSSQVQQNDLPADVEGAILEAFAPEGQMERRGWLFRGDPLVRQGLVLAAVSVTGETPVMVFEALAAEKSISEFVQDAGGTEAQMLEVYDETIGFLFERQGEQRDFPDSLVEGRIEWYQQAGRQMMVQPGLTPAYPGLHQLHVGIIFATARVSRAERGEIREALESCQTLEDVLKANGHKFEEALDLVMEHIDRWLQRLVEEGELTPEQSRDWLQGITEALEEMMVTHGLHLAGKDCAE